jgi:hypothetical protein
MFILHNRAFTYVAIYGDSFIASGKAVNALFKRRGWSSIISDTLCSTALFFVTLLIAVVVGVSAALLGLALGAAAGKVTIIAVIASYLMCSCFTSVLDAAVLTVIVCFAEDPQSLNEVRNRTYFDISCFFFFFFLVKLPTSFSCIIPLSSSS